MTNYPRIAFAFASVALSVALSGCCVTGVSTKRACQTPAVQPSYEQAIPQGIAPEEAWPTDVVQPPVETAPAPQPYVPPAPTPSSAARNMGTKTTMKIRQFSDSLRDTFTRS